MTKTMSRKRDVLGLWYQMSKSLSQQRGRAGMVVEQEAKRSYHQQQLQNSEPEVIQCYECLKPTPSDVLHPEKL